MDVDDAICEFAVIVEVDEDARLTCATFCDAVPGQAAVHDVELGAGPLFVPRYMARPTNTIMAMTTAAPTAAEIPARDSSNLILMTNSNNLGLP
jgi:hypothetical protein